MLKSGQIYHINKTVKNMVWEKIKNMPWEYIEVLCYCGCSKEN